MSRPVGRFFTFLEAEMAAKQQQRMVARRRSKSEWRALVERFERSGVSASAFSRKVGVSARTLGFWRWKLRQPSSAGRSGPAEFIEVTHPTAWRRLPDSAPLPVGRWTIDVIFPDGTTTRMGG